MKRGRKPRSDSAKVLRGTFQKVRARGEAMTPLAGDGDQPPWLNRIAARLWREKTAIYRRRGQVITGCEGVLAQYCALEAELVTRWKKGFDVPVAMINAYRLYASEFFDTPAAQQTAGAKTGDKNRFAANGRRPGAPGAAAGSADR